MTRSSPRGRPPSLTSPERRFTSSFLGENRNNELSHRDALIAAQIEHERVREAAIRVYELHELKEEHRRIVELERREEERLKAEALVVAEEMRLRELKAKSIPKPPPEPEPQPPKPAPVAAPAKAEAPPSVNGTTPKRDSKDPQPSTTPTTEVKKPAPAPGNPFAPQNKPAPSNPFAPTTQSKPSPFNTPAAAAQTQPTKASNPFAQPNGTTASQPAAVVKPQPAAAPVPTVDRYSQIHQELKKLRKELQAQSKVAGSPLKGNMGTFRREIRVCIGQLTGVKGANTQPTNKIIATLRAALEGRVPSPPIDVSSFTCDARLPVEGASHNEPTLPSLFIYLINICAKAIVNQFINEAGANPKAADPIGVFTAQIFSNKDFQWRGQSLIDILIAKLRITCPVLFGYRGNDKTERGRIAVGWKRDGSSWITEQNHNDRMSGLGAGFASISLRDFGKTAKTNPYPPTNYWKAMAAIVNTPPGETSNTQCIVLRAMIQGHEQRFLTFYGNAGLAALRLAVVEFPKKAPAGAMAAGSLSALVDVLKKEEGLILDCKEECY